MGPLGVLMFLMMSLALYSLVGFLGLKIFRKPVKMGTLGVFTASGFLCGVWSTILYVKIVGDKPNNLYSAGEGMGLIFTLGISAILGSIIAIQLPGKLHNRVFIVLTIIIALSYYF